MDGFDVYLDRSRSAEFYEICAYYENKIGNSLLGNIEYTEYEKMIQLSVNDYLALDKSGNAKKKGDFTTDFEFHKNSSHRVVPLALEAYFLRNENPENFIKNHNNIFDFCMRSKTNRLGSLELRYDDGKIVNVGTLVRYYLTTDKDAPQLFKIGIGTKDNVINAHENAPNDLGVQRIKYYNKKEELKDYNIDYNQYIYKVLFLIDKIENGDKVKSFIESLKPTNQLILF